MREIKFRGICRKEVKGDYPIKVGEWVYGYVAENTSGTYIVRPLTYNGSVTTFDFVEVDPSTVGQYTSLKDQKGVGIYEGDVIRFNGAVKFKIVYHGDRFTTRTLKDEHAPHTGVTYRQWKTATVIGNIHQHPELINQ